MAKGLGSDLSLFLHSVHVDSESQGLVPEDTRRKKKKKKESPSFVNGQPLGTTRTLARKVI